MNDGRFEEKVTQIQSIQKTLTQPPQPSSNH